MLDKLEGIIMKRRHTIAYSLYLKHAFWAILLCLVTLVFALLLVFFFFNKNRQDQPLILRSTQGGQNSPTNVGPNKPGENNKWITARKDLREQLSSNGNLRNESYSENLDDPQVFVKQDWTRGMPYDIIQRHIQQEEIPQLHEMLSDTDYKDYWPIVATIIGKISSDPNSVPILVDYIKRDDCEYLSEEMIFLKTGLPRYLGWIGGEKAKEVLMGAVSQDGALVLVENWIGSRPILRLWPTRDRALQIIQYSIIHGLAYLDDPEATAMIKELHTEAVKHYEATGTIKRLLCGLIDARIKIACREELGEDRFFFLDRNIKSQDKFPEHIRLKYSPIEREVVERIRQINESYKQGKK